MHLAVEIEDRYHARDWADIDMLGAPPPALAGRAALRK